ncbi:hypothetical protein V3F56_03655 [Moorellaceae bacterium AZ2]
MAKKKTLAIASRPKTRQIRLPADHWIWQLPPEARRQAVLNGLEIVKILQEEFRDLRRSIDLLNSEVQALREELRRLPVGGLDLGERAEEKPKKTGEDVLLENLDKLLNF